MSKKKQTEATEAEQKAAEQAADAAEQQAASAETAAQPDDEWKAKFDELNDRYLRMAAEYDNFRKSGWRGREQA